MAKNKKTRQGKRPYRALGSKMLHFLCSLVDSYKVRMIATYPKNPNCHKSYVYLTQVFILDSQLPKKKKTQCVVLLANM